MDAGVSVPVLLKYHHSSPQGHVPLDRQLQRLCTHMRSSGTNQLQEQDLDTGLLVCDAVLNSRSSECNNKKTLPQDEFMAVGMQGDHINLDIFANMFHFMEKCTQFPEHCLI